MTAPSPPFTPPPAWPTEAIKPEEPASARSQIAVYVVCSVAIAVASGATGHLGWGIAGMLALGAGIAIGIAAELGPRFHSLPGAVVAILAMMVLTVALAFVGGGVLAFACVPLLGAAILGLDWHLVRRLRPLPFACGFAVVLGVSTGASWTYPAGLVWLVLALGALASLEADRRAGQPQVVAVAGGPTGDDLRTGDLATTVLIAVAIALVAALLLSTPSCQRNDQAGNGTGQETGSESGSGESGSGSQNWGTGPGGASSDHLYRPDPDGRFLIPNDGGSPTDPSGDGVPSPELLPGVGEPPNHIDTPDGTSITAERLPDGSGRVLLQEPDGTTRTYEYRYRADGLIEIRERNADGTAGRTLFYDPEGRLATDDDAVTGGSDPSDGSQGPSSTNPRSEDRPEREDRDRPDIDGRLLALIALVLAALGGLVWWLSKRKPASPAPDAPPWAVRLARQIDQEGAARGPARRRSQSIARYVDDLRAGPLPDDRLPDLADVVSRGLYGRSDPGPEAQQWAEATWAEIVAAHPAPSRAERRRATAGAGARGGPPPSSA